MITKTKQTIVKQITLGICLLLLAGVRSALAASGVWTADADGNWSDTTKWGGATVADGTGSTADFSAINITADRTVTLDAAHTLSILKFGDIVPDHNWFLSGSYTLTLGTTPTINVINQTATVSSSIAGTAGLTKIGAGTLTLGGATETFTGGLSVNAGTLKLDYSASGSPVSTLIPSQALKLGGGTLQMIGNSAGTSQSFASTAISATTAGQSIVSAASASGTIPTVNLGTLTGLAGGLVRFDGPAYNSDASSGTTLGGTTVAATATINATALYSGTGGILIYNHGPSMSSGAGAYATVGLYDWACISTGTLGTNVAGYITGASQISGFYTVATSLPANSYGVNYDLTASSTMSANSSSQGSEISSLRINANGAITITCGRAVSDNSVAAMLITPNVGANNTTIAPGTYGFQASRENTSAKGPPITFTAWQNNVLGELVINAPYGDSYLAGSGYVQGGPGTVLLSGINTYTGQSYLDGGFTVIGANSGLGAIATGANVNLNGGTLLGNATFSLDNAGANLRQIYVSGAGGTLAASSGNTLTVNGYISGSANLNIGTGTIAGTGAGTANPTAIVGSGTVVLNGAGNGYSGGTAISGGATLNINSVWALGGAAYGGLTFNNGTLQYNSTPLNVALDITEDTSNGGTGLAGGVAKPVWLAGNGTIDVNGNTVVYTNAVGNNGSGALTVASTLANGSLKLLAPNTYTGDTTISGGTLALGSSASLASPNITVGSGATFDVSALSSYTLASGKTLLGGGVVTGSVSTASSAMIIPGTLGTVGTLTFNNNLTLNTGETNYFDLSGSPSGSNDKIVVTGALNLSGTKSTIVVNFTGLPTAGTYKLFTYGTKTGTAAANLAYTLTGYSIGSLTASLSDATAGEIDLVLSSSHTPTAITWLGTVDNHWNVTTLNWNSPDNKYYDSDFVTFDSNGQSQPNVNLATALAPGSVTVDTSVNDYTFSGPGQIGAGTLTKNSSGTLTITTTNTLPGPVMIQGGALQVGDGVNSGAIGAGIVTNNAALVMDSPATVATGPITGTGNVTIKAGGTLAIGGDSILGSLTLGSSDASATTGTLDLANHNATVTGLALGSDGTGGTIGSSGTSTASTLSYLGGNSTFGGVIQDTLGSGNKPVALYVNTSGTLTLSGTVPNPYSGGTVLGGGTIALASAGTGYLGTGSVTITNGATLALYRSGNTDNSTSGGLAIPVVVPAGQTANILNSPRGTLSSTLTGGGMLGLRVNATRCEFTGNWNGFSGQVNVTSKSGTSDDFRIAIGGTTDSTFANLKLNLGVGVNMYQDVNPPTGSGTETKHNIGELSGSAGSTLGGNPVSGRFADWSVGALNTSATFAGNIVDNTGATRLTKVGAGTLTLSGNNTYSGATWVNAGTLTVNGTITASPMTNYSGTFLTGTGTVFSADMEAGSTITPIIDANSYGTLAVNGGDLTFNGGTNLVQISSNPTVTNSLITVATGGYLNLNGGVVKLVINGGALADGLYPLMTYTPGAYQGDIANLVLGGFSQSGQVAKLTNDTTLGLIELSVETRATANLIWASTGNNYWDIGNSANWTNGTSLDAFYTGDHVTFNDSGAANSPVDLRAAVQPSSMVVTGAQAYVFESTTGAGSLAGATNSLTVMGTGSLEVDIVNSYGGQTAIGSGYTLTVGNGNNAASLGSGIITNQGTLIFNQTNNLSLSDVSGTGTLTKNGTNTLTLAGAYTYTGNTTIGAGATLQVGTNGPSGSLSSAVTDNGTLILNVSGSVAASTPVTGSGTFIKNGSSTLALNVTNAYQANTYLNNGVVKLGVAEAIPSAATVAGSTGWLVLDGGATAAGTLDMNGFNQSVNALSGNNSTVNGLITNSATSGISKLLVVGDSLVPSSTYYGTIQDNGSGAIQLAVTGGGALTLEGANDYSGGTIVGAGTTLTLANFTAAGSGSITLSNTATVGLINNTGLTTNNIYTVAGATVTNTATGASSCSFGGTFSSGDANSTNVIAGSIAYNKGATEQFAGFLGTVLISPTSSMRFSSTALSDNGGPNATFEIEGTLYTRNGMSTASGIQLGALTGAGTLTGANTASVFNGDAYTIGGKNIDSTFTGTIQDGTQSTVAIIKTGTGRLTLSGTASFTGGTTVNGGVLALVDPFVLDSNATINVSSGTIDVSGLTTEGKTLNLGILKAQTLSGIGTINGSLAEAAGSSVKVGLGTLAITNAATFNGNLTLQLNRTNAVNCSQITAHSYSINCPLTVTNVGPALQGGDTFQLFGSAVSGFTVTNLPTLTGSMYWTNNLAVDGSISVVSTATVSANADLTGITLTPVVAFTPNFDSNTLSGYTATESYGSTFMLTVTNADPTATNQLTYQGSLVGLLTNAVAYGPLSLNANPGFTNLLSVLVTAQDGVTTKTYTVNVVQIPSQAAFKLTNGVSGTNLVLNWDLAHLGYRLLEQTNNLNKGVSSNTNDWSPVIGSQATNMATIPIVRTNLNKYYRLVYP